MGILSLPKLKTRSKDYVKNKRFNVKELQNNHEESYFKFITLLEDIFTKYSDKEFSLKIHPFEKSEEYIERFKAAKKC